MRKYFALVLAMALCLFGCSANTAPSETTAATAETTVTASKEDVVILYTNDVHTYIDKPLSYDVLAGIKYELENTYGEGNVLLADAGDHVQGTAYGSMDEGDTIIALMNAVGYDIATLGNHEFDYGIEKALTNVEAAAFPYISCNFYNEKDGVKGDSVLEAAHIFETDGGLTVAFVGITTPETFTKSTPAYFQDGVGNYIYAISGGETALTLDNYDADGNRLVRSRETNTGDFCADALYYLFDNMGLDVDVAIMNGGGIRNEAVTGDLTYKTAKSIHTFGNVACLQTITGQQLLDALEWGARSAGTGEEYGGFLQVSGITYKIDTQWPESTQKDDKGVWIGSPTGGYRVHSVEVYNKETQAYEPLDLTASYNLAGYNYTLRNLGDGFNMFFSAVNVLDFVMEDYMVLANYITGFEDGVVEAGNSPLLVKYPGMLLDYATVDGSGRIVMETATR